MKKRILVKDLVPAFLANGIERKNVMILLPGETGKQAIKIIREIKKFYKEECWI